MTKRLSIDREPSLHEAREMPRGLQHRSDRCLGESKKSWSEGGVAGRQDSRYIW